MYHRVGTPVFPDEGDYALSQDLFASHLGCLAGSGRAVISLDDLAEGRHADGAVAFTFDDGYDSDALTAAPLLRSAGFRGAFFVSALLVGTPGFVSWPQLRAMADQGFVVGSHGLDHALLDGLPASEVRRQIEESKRRIEDGVGRPVSAFTLPGGSGGERARRMAEEAGYSLVLGSRPGLVRGDPGSGILPRFAMRKRHGPDELEALLQCRPWHILGLSLRYRLAHRARLMLSSPVYGRLRQMWLDRPSWGRAR
jgi:peptidoglycan/xylan/chitin deacetylase (PgdA/CDA1 family)